jgi:hypothetical protein
MSISGYQCFDDFGLEVHRRPPGDNGDYKCCYTNPETYDAEDRNGPLDDDHFSIEPVVADGIGSTTTIASLAN